MSRDEGKGDGKIPCKSTNELREKKECYRGGETKEMNRSQFLIHGFKENSSRGEERERYMQSFFESERYQENSIN